MSKSPHFDIVQKAGRFIHDYYVKLMVQNNWCIDEIRQIYGCMAYFERILGNINVLAS